MKISAAKFKAECLRLMDEVAQSRSEVVITKRGKPVARLVAILSGHQTEQRTGVFGRMRNTVDVVGDLTQPLELKWDADG